MRKESGSVGDFIAATLCMLAMTVLLNGYMDSVRMIQQKTEVAQIARKYILQMETTGLLREDARLQLCEELQEIGVNNISLEGTTTWRVTYGDDIVLQIRGELENGFTFTERKVSTAKY